MPNETSPLDAHRPWITDPAELPSNLNWFATLLWPMGRSPKLHFTRAWTFLFMACLMALVLPPLINMVLGLGGGGRVGWFGAIFPTVLILSVVPLFFIHVRRLNDAGRSPFSAWLVFAPLVLAGVVFGGVMMASGGAESGDPGAPSSVEQSAEQGAAIQSQARRGRGRGGRGGRGRGGRPGGGPPSPEAKAQQMAGTFGFIVYALGNIMLTWWSLMRIARLPSRD